MVKKILSVVMAAVLMVSCFAGCGGGSGGTVTLKWAIGHANQRDTAIVQQELNKMLDEHLPGIQIEFIEQTTDKWDNWMAAGQQIDIAWTGYSYDMESQTKMKAFTALDDLIAEYAPNIQKEMEDYKLDYDTGRYTDGKLYAIPNEQPFIQETPYLIIPAETMEYFDVDAFLAATAASPYTTREVYEVFDEYLQKVKANDATDTDFVGKYISVNYVMDLVSFRGYYQATNDYYYKVWNDDGTIVEDPELEYIFDTEAYKLWLEYAVKWQKEGFIAPSLVDTGISGSQYHLISGHLSGMWNDFSNEGDDESRGIHSVTDSYGNIVAYNINIEPRDYSHKYYEGAVYGAESTYMVIPLTAKYPVEAIKLLDFMRAEKGTPGNDFLNMVVYGFAEGSSQHEEYGVYHYTLNGDQIHSDEYVQQANATTSYGQPHWAVGNVYLVYRTELIAEGQQEYAFEYDSKTRLTLPVLPTAGFTYDADIMATKSDSVVDVWSDYAPRLHSGLEKDNTTALMNEAYDKLKKAGLEDIKAEWMKQYNEWKSSK